jgi:hypothetical protein
VFQKQTPADHFFMKGPSLSTHLYLAADWVSRNLVPLVERDFAEIAERNWVSRSASIAAMRALVARPPNVRNGSKADISAYETSLSYNPALVLACANACLLRHRSRDLRTICAMLCSQLGPSASLLAATFAVTLAVRSPVTLLTVSVLLWERDGSAQRPD